MCGICGFTKNKMHDPTVTQADLHAMTQALTHRGPDEAGIFHSDDIALGSRRLKIIDLDGGQQPVMNETGTVRVVFNGEIYNYRHLRTFLESKGHRFLSQSDTEVIPHLYEEKGVNCFEQLNGMFAIALWDETKKQLIMARDRFGIKPLYYAQNGAELIFSSEIKSLRCYTGIGQTLDIAALNQFLTYQYIPGPRSIFENIKKLPPAHYLVYSPSGMTVQRYWDISHHDQALKNISDAEATEHMMHLLRTSVKRRLMSDVPLGFLLSGGLDSSALCALMRQMGESIKTFSVGFDVPSFDESSDARLVAEHVGSEHHEAMFTQNDFFAIMPEVVRMLDEPYADPSIFPTYFLSGFAKQYVTVAVGGEGGDEIFAGYPTYQVAQYAHWYGWMPRTWRKKISRTFPRVLPVNLTYYSFDYKLRKLLWGLPFDEGERNIIWLGAFTPEDKKGLFAPWARELLQGGDIFAPVRGYIEPLAYRDPITRAQYFDIKTYLVDDLLVKIDRASMAHSLEMRVPYLDHELVDYVLNLPAHLRVRGLWRKHILKEGVKDLLPAHVLKKRKQGFAIPAALWMKGPLQKVLREMLLDGTSGMQFFNRTYVEQLFNDHMSGKQNNYRQLWTLFMFLLWHEHHN